MGAKNELFQFINQLPSTSPKAVNSKHSVKNWDQRKAVASSFVKHRQAHMQFITSKCTYYNHAGVASSYHTIKSCLIPKINFPGKMDAGTLAVNLALKNKVKPIIIIAANSHHIGGSLYRTNSKGTGDSQEEQVNDSFAGALSLASIPGVCSKIKGGELHYSAPIREILETRGAISVENVPGIKNTSSDHILVAAPNLAKGECKNEKGEFDPRSYAEQISKMYFNAFLRISKLPSNQPIILTLPGLGVFAGHDPSVKDTAKAIHKICIRNVFAQFPQLINREFYLPYASAKHWQDLDVSSEFGLFLKVHSAIYYARKSHRLQQLCQLDDKPLDKVCALSGRGLMTEARQVFQDKIRVTLYPANLKNDKVELGLSFPSPEEAKAFLNCCNLPSSLFRPHYKWKNVLFMKGSLGPGTLGAYKSKGEIVINLGQKSPKSRKAFCDLLGLKPSDYELKGQSVHIKLPAKPHCGMNLVTYPNSFSNKKTFFNRKTPHFYSRSNGKTFPARPPVKLNPQFNTNAKTNKLSSSVLNDLLNQSFRNPLKDSKPKGHDKSKNNTSKWFTDYESSGEYVEKLDQKSPKSQKAYCDSLGLKPGEYEIKGQSLHIKLPTNNKLIKKRIMLNPQSNTKAKGSGGVGSNLSLNSKWLMVPSILIAVACALCPIAMPLATGPFYLSIVGAFLFSAFSIGLYQKSQANQNNAVNNKSVSASTTQSAHTTAVNSTLGKNHAHHKQSSVQTKPTNSKNHGERSNKKKLKI